MERGLRLRATFDLFNGSFDMELKTILSGACALLPLAPIASSQVAFQSAQNVSLTGLRPDWIAVGDFDGINGLDFAVTTGGAQGGGGLDRVEIFTNAGGGTFTPGPAVVLGANVGAAALIAGDFDQDGDPDLAVSLKDANSVVVLTNVGGVFSAGLPTPTGGIEPRHMAAGDIDADGDLDLVTSNRDSNNVSVLTNDGNGGFAFNALLPTGLDPRFLALESLDGDCSLDLVVAAADSRRLEVYFNNGAGGFGASLNLPVPLNNKPSGVATADLDGDGNMDLATSTDQNDVGQICTWRNIGGGAFVSSGCVTIGGQDPGALVAVDLDADGDIDMATVDEDGSVVSFAANAGGGIFVPSGSQVVGSSPSHMAGGDFNGDGSIDLVTANRDSNNASILMNASVGGTEVYCSPTANSAGAGTRIGSRGSLSIASNTFTLTVRCGPASVPGLFFYGTTRRNAPFGNGRRCVGGMTARLDFTFTDASGSAARLLDFPGLRVPITAGMTRTFQFWHRDATAGGAAFDTSDGLSATFLP